MYLACDCLDSVVSAEFWQFCLGWLLAFPCVSAGILIVRLPNVPVECSNGSIVLSRLKDHTGLRTQKL